MAMKIMDLLGAGGMFTARINTIVLVGMFGVIGTFLVLGVRCLLGIQGPAGVLSSAPFYQPSTFNLVAIATATSFAALTYIGVDGLTTLAEEAKNPERNVPLAVVSVCLFTTLFSCLLVYLAALIWPDYTAFPDIETAFMYVTERVGGPMLFQALGIVVILSSFGAALAGQIAAARVPYAMGRDDILPRRVFAALTAGSAIPVFIAIVATVAWIGSFLLSLEHAGVLLNFGAFLAFMGVNLAALRQCYFLKSPHERRVLVDAMPPLLGFLFCFGIWVSLPMVAKVVGGTWLAVGIGYYVWRIKGAGHKSRAHATFRGGELSSRDNAVGCSQEQSLPQASHRRT
jgi:amino acid transporter